MESDPQVQPDPSPPKRLRLLHVRSLPFLWQGKVGPALWTFGSVLSLTLNIILIVVVVLLGRQFFALKDLLSDQLVGGLYLNFQQMDQAHIKTTITVNDTIQVNDTLPVVFDLPVSRKTTVVLTQDSRIPNTWVALSTVGQGINLRIDAPADITLPEGTPLDIKLDLVVPVSTTVPVVLDVPVSLRVPVDIPLDQTELHQPFVGLQNVLDPYRGWLAQTPASWEEISWCKGGRSWLCRLFKP